MEEMPVPIPLITMTRIADVIPGLPTTLDDPQPQELPVYVRDVRQMMRGGVVARCWLVIETVTTIRGRGLRKVSITFGRDHVDSDDSC